MKKLLLCLALNLSCFLLKAQSAFEVWYYVEGIQNHGLILANNNSSTWLYRVKYFDSDCNCTKLIEQNLHVSYDESVGYWLKGSTPWDIKARRYATNYYADNFFMLYDERGNVTMKNYDNQGVYVNVTVGNVTNYSLSRKKQEFGW